MPDTLAQVARQSEGPTGAALLPDTGTWADPGAADPYKGSIAEALAFRAAFVVKLPPL
jgi:hypothetical protein